MIHNKDLGTFLIAVCPQQKTMHSHAAIYSSRLYDCNKKGVANEVFWELQARCGVNGVRNKA